MTFSFFLVIVLIAVATISTNAFMVSPRSMSGISYQRQSVRVTKNAIKMNFFEDAVRFFSNMKKEASAKHILIKGAGATEKLNILKAELVGVEDLSAAFSELASKVRNVFGRRNSPLNLLGPHVVFKLISMIAIQLLSPSSLRYSSVFFSLMYR